MICLFWGLLLISFDINIFGLEVLTDIAGWVLMILGCRKLESYSRKFEIASILSAAMIVLSIASFAVKELLGLNLGIVMSAAELIVCLLLAKGFSDAEDKLLTDLGYDELYKVWVIKVVTLCLSAVLGFFPYFGVVAVIAHFIVSIIFMARVYKMIKAIKKSEENCNGA